MNGRHLKTAVCFCAASLVSLAARADESVAGVATICAPSAGYFSLHTVRLFNDLIRPGRAVYDEFVFVPDGSGTKVHECILGDRKIEVWTRLDKAEFDQGMCGATKGYLFKVVVDGEVARFPRDPAGTEWSRAGACVASQSEKHLIATLFKMPDSMTVKTCVTVGGNEPGMKVRECSTQYLGE